MGQYYKIVNLDKRQYLKPHDFGDGAKLMEFGSSGEGTMLALAVLLSDGNGRGGGDFSGDDAIVGSWAGDRIVVTGDYADERKFVSDGEGAPDDNLYSVATETFENISAKVQAAFRAGGEDIGERIP